MSTKSYNKTKHSLETVNKLQEQLKETDTNVMLHLGYKSSSALTDWRRAGLAPVTAGLAAEALLRRMGKRDALPNGEVVVCCRASGDDLVFLKTIANKLGIELKEI